MQGIGDHEGCFGQAMQDALHEGAFVDQILRKRLVAIYMQRFAGVQGLAVARLQSVANVYDAFFHFHQRGFFIVHTDIERGPAD